MLDKIFSLSLLPFFGFWKILLDKNWISSVKQFQKRLLQISFLLLSFVVLTLFFEINNITLKTALLLLSFFCFLYGSVNYLTEISIGVLKRDFEEERILIYRRNSVFVYLGVPVLVSALITANNSAVSLICLVCTAYIIIHTLIYVGFEFPDDPPKKKEEGQENGSWLAKLLPQKPVVSV